MLYAAPAFAIFNVSSPGIEEGAAEIESRNRYDVDDIAARDGRVISAIKATYGFTDRFGMELQGDWQDAPGHSLNYAATELEGKFRFYDPGAYWLDFALKIAYEVTHESATADAVKTKFLFGKTIDQWTFLNNINLSREVGSYAEGAASLSTAWQARYAVNKHFQPSLEMYNSFGDIRGMESYSGQSHRLGPVIHGEITESVKYQLGYLFGISNAAEDHSFKLFLKYEIPL